MSSETAALETAQRIARELRARYKRERARLDALNDEAKVLAGQLENISAELALAVPLQKGGIRGRLTR